MTNEIVVGYDGSDGAKAALAHALALAKDLGGSVVVTFGYEPTRMAGEIADHREALKELGEQKTSEALTEAEAAGVPAERELVAESGPDALVSVAEARDARMIAVGSYGESPLKGAILGSTPHKLLQLSERPVLVVRA